MKTPTRKHANTAMVETIVHSSRGNKISTEDTTKSKEATRADTEEDTKAEGATTPPIRRINPLTPSKTFPKYSTTTHVDTMSIIMGTNDHAQRNITFLM